jgi:hypothetical protein
MMREQKCSSFGGAYWDRAFDFSSCKPREKHTHQPTLSRLMFHADLCAALVYFGMVEKFSTLTFRIEFE